MEDVCDRSSVPGLRVAGNDTALMGCGVTKSKGDMTGGTEDWEEVSLLASPSARVWGQAKGSDFIWR